MNRKFAKLFVLGVLMFSIALSVSFQGAAAGGPIQQQDLQYSCPMHAEVKSKSAGTCPKCGMTLKQVPNTSAAVVPTGTPWGANYFPNVTLTTQDGKTVHFYDDLLKDKVVAIELMYTQCRYNCPLETARLVQVQNLLGDQMGKGVFFYSISIDPKRDTPAALKAYAEKFQAGPGWLFLTGKEEDIELISKKLGLYSNPDPSNPDGHTPVLMIGNVAGGIWMRSAALGDARFLARRIGEFIDDRQSRKVEVAKSYSEAPKLSLNGGQYLFSARCDACHTIGHGDKATGPDLLGVTSTRDRAWLRRIIAVPDQLLAEKDPVATALFKKYKEIQMPNLWLSEAEVSILIDYIEAQTAAARDKEPLREKAGTMKQTTER